MALRDKSVNSHEQLLFLWLMRTIFRYKRRFLPYPAKYVLDGAVVVRPCASASVYAVHLKRVPINSMVISFLERVFSQKEGCYYLEVCQCCEEVKLFLDNKSVCTFYAYRIKNDGATSDAKSNEHRERNSICFWWGDGTNHD